MLDNFIQKLLLLKSKKVLGFLSFIESIFFPIPTDVLLIPMAISKSYKWIDLALIATVASVIGGVIGYYLGVFLFHEINPYIIQYGLGHIPCKVCIYERVPYILSIILIIKILFFKKYEKITLLLLSIIFIFSTILAFYHLGIEQGFFKESFVCESNNFSKSLTKEQLIEQLKENSISCKDVSFALLGISLAGINTIFSLILSFVFTVLFINYKKNYD